jgi:hypothetical protein
MSTKSDPAVSKNTPLVRELQSLMLLFSVVPPDGKLSEAMKLALSTSAQSYGSKIGPINHEGVRSYLEQEWRSDPDQDRRRLLEWQKSGDNMKEAVEELAAARSVLGLGEGLSA